MDRDVIFRGFIPLILHILRHIAPVCVVIFRDSLLHDRCHALSFANCEDIFDNRVAHRANDARAPLFDGFEPASISARAECHAFHVRTHDVFLFSEERGRHAHLFVRHIQEARPVIRAQIRRHAHSQRVHISARRNNLRAPIFFERARSRIRVRARARLRLAPRIIRAFIDSLGRARVDAIRIAVNDRISELANECGDALNIISSRGRYARRANQGVARRHYAPHLPIKRIRQDLQRELLRIQAFPAQI
ncbi:MAG: hypothetical protein M0R66_09670 [Candidatus Omnitrophica bacterium]|nr:hypothetical protein [Candidatus Omnitrophota bacterium]